VNASGKRDRKGNLKGLTLSGEVSKMSERGKPTCKMQLRKKWE
jgi:hypothetical protein